MYVSAIANQCNIERTHPARFAELSRYIDHLAQHTGEAEMIWQDTRTGRKFIGWKLTEHGQKLLEVS